MKSTSYSFFDTLTLELRGDEGRAVRQMRKMYDHFEAPAVDNPDVVCEVTRTKPDSTVVFGDPEDNYGRDGSWFVIQNGPNFVKLNVETNRIQMWPDMEPFYVVYIIEFMIRKRLADQGRALVHASGVNMDGHTTLFPAWRGAGKTNTLLSLLSAGGDFLSDDRLWVGRDGSVLGYPLSVNMQSYNLESFPDITLDEDNDEDVRHQVSRFIEDNFSVSGSLFEKGLVFFNRHYLKEDGRTFLDVDDMVPSASFVEADTVDAVVVLRAAPKADNVSIEPLSPADAVTETKTISWYEWNARLREYFSALDSLFSEQHWVDELDDLIADEQQVFETLFEDVATYRAEIPRERDWNTTGIRRQVVDTVRQLAEHPEDEQPETVDLVQDSHS